jgi:hypothetical protein
MDKLLTQISPDMNKYLDGVFQTIDENKPQILRLCIQYRLFENGIVGGKLHRMVYENILQHFGSNTASSEDQTLFAIKYLSDKLPDIIWRDFEKNIL